MDWLFVLIAFAVGLLLGSVLVWFWLKAGQQRALHQYQQECDGLNSQLEAFEAENTQLKADLAAVTQSRVRAETLLEAAQKQFDAQEKTFEALALKLLNAKQDELDSKTQQQTERQQKVLHENITGLLKPLRDVIDEHQKKVNSLEKQHLQETSSLQKHIELVVKETSQLASAKESLVEALSNSKGRGDWGEMQLLRLLEQSGLREGVDYEFQKTVEGSRDRPDVTLLLSNNRRLYIDVKTILKNLDQHISQLESGEADEAQRKKHADSLEREVLSLRKKAYEEKSTESIDFVVLYLPRESMLRVALEEKPYLMEQAFHNRVLLASPLILMAILKTVAYGWEQAQLSKNAQEIQTLGKELHRRASRFLERFEELGKKIEGLSGTYDNTRRALVGRQGMTPQLQKFQDLGCQSERQFPEALMAAVDEDTADEDLLVHLDDEAAGAGAEAEETALPADG